MTELQILSAIRNNGGSIGYTELLNLAKTDPIPDHIADHHRLLVLKSSNCISGNLDAFGVVCLEPNGTVLLDRLQQSLQQQNDDRTYEAAENRKEKRSDLITTLVGALIGAILTLIVELII